jgi:uncharacterized protein (TIGR03435 family)
MKTILTGIFLVAFNSLGLYCQPSTAPPRPAFEVASIKIVRNPAQVCIFPCIGERLTVEGSRVDIRFMSLYQLIVRAYRVKPYQLSGPNWMTSQKFDVVAKMPDGASKDQISEMLQILLAERFRLSLHRESKEHSVYALVVGKNGSKLKTSTAKANAFVTDDASGRALNTPYGEAHMGENGVWQIREGPYGPIRMSMGQNVGTTQVDFLRITMPGLAEALTPSVDRVVVDETGLKGIYQIQVDWSVPPPSGSTGEFPLSAPPPSLSFQSIEKAGLKLEMRRAPVEMIVVDNLEKTPTDN